VAIEIIKIGGSVWGERKNGGTPDSVELIASKIKRIDPNKKVVLVVSAFKGVTDNLIKEATSTLLTGCDPVTARHARSAYIAQGETEAANLIALALGTRSFQGIQVPFCTDDTDHPHIDLEASGEGLLGWLRNNKTAVVAGFQGVNRDTQIITTFARGGTDLSAIATAIILKDRFAEAGEEVVCRIIRDNGGVRTADPKLVEDAQIHSTLSYDELYAISVAGGGQQLMQTEAMALAKAHNVVLSVGRFDDEDQKETRVTSGQAKGKGIIAVACNSTGDARNFVDISVVGWHLNEATKGSMRQTLQQAGVEFTKIGTDEIEGVDPAISAISASVPNTPETVQTAVRALHEGFRLAA